MGISVQTLVLARKYTKDSILGLGALEGAPCTIKSITKADGINTVTFEWTGDDRVTKNTSEMLVADGITITKVEVNENNELIVTLSDNTTQNAGTIKTIKGDKGESGFSPTITENVDNTDTVYKLDITNENGTFTTPNLSSGGIDMSNYYTKEEVDSTFEEKIEEEVGSASDADIDSLFG